MRIQVEMDDGHYYVVTEAEYRKQVAVLVSVIERFTPEDEAAMIQEWLDRSAEVSDEQFAEQERLEQEAIAAHRRWHDYLSEIMRGDADML